MGKRSEELYQPRPCAGPFWLDRRRGRVAL